MKLLFFLFSCVLVLAQIRESRSCFTEERAALLNIKAFLYNQTDFYGHRHSPITDYPLSSWIHNPNSDCCRWNRVACNPFSGHVTELYLQDLRIHAFNFNFTMDLSLFQTFKELRILNLSIGYFDSLIHVEVLANLSNLEVLSMKENFEPFPIEGLCGLKKIRVLDLSANNLEGPFPKCFGNMTFLQGLDLSGNLLSGEIPTSVIASLGSLEYLSLEFIEFEGLFSLSSFANNSHLKVLTLGGSSNDKILQVETEIDEKVPCVPSFQLEVLHIHYCKLNAPRSILPSFLLYQHELQHLDLSNNNLVGQFPNWLLINNTQLEFLQLRHNYFTGSFELRSDRDQHPHSLNYLDLAYNKIVGKLPQAIGHIFPNLGHLDVSYNGLYGAIPTSVGSLSKLIILDLSNNNLSGKVPKILWMGCASLRQLILSDNSLQGQLFPLSLNLPKLEYLLLHNNSFSGTLQPGMLPRIIVLGISNNELGGTIPDFIGNLSYLQVIDLSWNNFTGALPRELCKLDLYFVHLSHLKLSGSIPACYLNLPHLVALLLESNNLVGSIPKLRKISSSLTLLDLRDNNLYGKIPGWVSHKIRNLTALLLGGNHLQGQLPDSLCQLEEINFLDLSRNEFIGPIPGCFSNVTFGGYTNELLHQSFQLDDSIDTPYQYHHLYMEPLPLVMFYHWETTETMVEFRTKGSLLTYKGEIMYSMSGLDLSGNQLTGLIPHEMGNMASLHALNLSHNHLNGSIPESFHTLEAIESLDLSCNNLSDEIPPRLQELNTLEVFNVSYNNLSGTVPNKGQLAAFDESSFIGNPYLIWNNSNRGTTKRPPPTTGSHDGGDDDSIIDFTFFYWSFAASYVTISLSFVTILWINLSWRRSWFYFIETCLFKCFHRILGDAFY